MRFNSTNISVLIDNYSRDEHEAGSEPDCAVFLLEPDCPNCSLVLNWIGPGLTLYKLGYIIFPFEKHFYSA